MAKYDPIDYEVKPDAGFLSCHGCDFNNNEPMLTCDLTWQELQEFTHMHGDCAINGYIYTRKPANIQ